MSREIKFRAWDVKNKNMLIIFDSTAQSSWFIPEWKDNIIPMQFTGLHDKNGCEIYEGDIVRYQHSPFNKNPVKVGFIKYFACGFYIATADGNLKGTVPDNIEVIGNRFENPDLLEADA